MPTFPVRQLGASGINTDTSPSDLDSVGSLTAGVNVRFKNGRVSRAPLPRTVAALPHQPGHALALPPGPSGYDEVITIAQDFSSVYRLNGTTFENLTPIDHVGTSGTAQITSCLLGGVSYVNRETHVPIYKRVGDSTYAILPNWEDGVRCRVMRSYKDQLVALGVTKSGTYYPTMVKWSDFATFNAAPASWDPGSTTNSAGENIVNEMTHELVDGLSLRDSFILYCSGSVWQMDYTGDASIYQFRKLFDANGIIAPHCAVQVGGLHYVFDRNDIYVHDGVAPRSIADNKVRKFIFDALDFSRVHLCFVAHDPKLSEIRFVYPSVDRLIGYRNADTGCNRQAVFNYSDGNWTFDDVPNVTGYCRSALVSGPTWEDDATTAWNATGGAWAASQGDLDRHFLYVGRTDAAQGLSAPRIYGFDLINGGRLPLPAEPEALKPSFIERVGIDLDSIGKNLTQYVQLQAIWPQVAMDQPEDAYWQFGASELFDAQPSWSPETTFDPRSETKIDINEAGKYLGYRFGCRGEGDFRLTGFDAQLIIRGRR